MSFHWKVYFFIFTLFTVNSALSILFPGSVLWGYYHILIAFNPAYIIPYYLNVASATINLVALVPLFLFVFRRHYLKPAVWQWLLAARIVCDITGHAYDIQLFKAYFHINPIVAIGFFISLIVLFSPSYYACFCYAFRQKKIFDSSNIPAK